MDRHFGLVDAKVAEANFFLKQLAAPEANFFTARCYFSAFVSSTRSITFALQAVMAGVDGFTDWYAQHQKNLRANPAARFFHDARTIDQHEGINVVTSGERTRLPDGTPVQRFYFTQLPQNPNAPTADVVTASHEYLTTLISIVLDCYRHFGNHIDPRQYFSAENFHRMGRTITDAEEEVFGVPGWTETPGVPLEVRWEMLRNSVADCSIRHLFQEYLGCES